MTELPGPGNYDGADTRPMGKAGPKFTFSGKP